MNNLEIKVTFVTNLAYHCVKQTLHIFVFLVFKRKKMTYVALYIYKTNIKTVLTIKMYKK